MSGMQSPLLRIESPAGLHAFCHEAMATEFVFSLGGVDVGFARQVAHEAFRVVDDIESKLSLYRESSDISRINLCGSGDTVMISAACSECLQAALEASQLTSERFQIFVGGPACRAKGNVPSFLRAKVGESAPAVGAGEDIILLDPKSRQVTKLREGVVVDLGGIGKGFALDQVIEMLEDWEIPFASLNSGGSTHLFKTFEGEPARWVAELGELALEPLNSGALASSGFGFNESHIIDPATGGSFARWRRSYARAGSAAMADALSTAAILMEAEALADLARNRPDVSLAVETEKGDVFAYGGFFAGPRD